MPALSRKNLWEAAPGPVKTAVGCALALAPPSVLLGARFRATRRFIDEAQWWPVERVRAYQLEQLRRICALACDKSPYYRRVFREAGFVPAEMRRPEDLAGLLTIDKQTLREQGEDMLAGPRPKNGADLVSTGGTSGEPLRFWIGAGRSAIEYAYLTASWARVGYDLRCPQAVLRGQVVPADRRGLRHSYDPILRRHNYSNFHLTDENMRRYVEHIRGIGPCFLHVYPSSGAALTTFVERSGITPPDNVRAILAGSENVYPEDRVRIERVWGARYFSWYGHSEKLVMGAECEKSTDYHIWPTYGYFELLDENGEPVTTPGQRGEIVGTGFINTVMPFIRYRTGDYATYVADRCDACGRVQPIVRDIEGRRASGGLVARDGSLISMTALNVHDGTFQRVRRYQFYQDTIGETVVRVVPLNGFGEEDKKRIIKTLARRVNDRVKLTVEVCEEIPLSPRGKAIWVDQRLDVEATKTQSPSPSGAP
jgi:phenylacetate-CoA ligase